MYLVIWPLLEHVQGWGALNFPKLPTSLSDGCKSYKVLSYTEKNSASS